MMIIDDFISNTDYSQTRLNDRTRHLVWKTRLLGIPVPDGEC